MCIRDRNEDELQQLDYLDNYNHDYNAGNVYLGFQTGLTLNSVTTLSYIL